jgi:hypothetical protein
MTCVTDRASVVLKGLPLCDLILAVLLRRNRPCSPQEIVEVIADAGLDVPDRQRFTAAIQTELVTAALPGEAALFELQGSRDDHWGPSAAFTAWLMNRGLPSLQGLMPRFPVETANDA